VSSTEMRQRVFAAKRANRIATALQLDDEEFKRIEAEAVAEYAKRYDGPTWRVFIGTATDAEKSQYEAEQKAMHEAAGLTQEEGAAAEAEAFADRIAPRVDHALDAERQTEAPGWITGQDEVEEDTVA